MIRKITIKEIAQETQKNRGTSKKMGISTEQVCDLVERYKNNHTLSEIATFGWSSADEIDRLLGG